MVKIIRAVIYAIVTVSVLAVTFFAFAGPFYDIMTSFDTIVAGEGLPNLTTFWNTASPVLKTFYFIVGILSILGVLFWLFMYAQKREYVTGGYYS